MLLVLRQWLWHDHSNDMWKVIWENPSYIFFREIPGAPVGAEQVPLTAGRSLSIRISFRWEARFSSTPCYPRLLR